MNEGKKNSLEKIEFLETVSSHDIKLTKEQELLIAQCIYLDENPFLMVEDTGSGQSVTYNHQGQTDGKLLTMAAMGIQSSSFYEHILAQLGALGPKGKRFDEATLNFAVDAIKGIAPKDTVEVMQAAQMTAIHIQAMRYARRMNLAENYLETEAAERAFNRLTRSFAAHVEAMKRYRAGAHQTLRVEQVNVGEGGQAIVGSVSNQTKPKKMNH